MAFATAIGDIFPLVTAITDTNVSNGCDNGAVKVIAMDLDWSKSLEMLPGGRSPASSQIASIWYV